jgi:hypothetical protein
MAVLLNAWEPTMASGRCANPAKHDRTSHARCLAMNLIRHRLGPRHGTRASPCGSVRGGRLPHPASSRWRRQRSRVPTLDCGRLSYTRDLPRQVASTWFVLLRVRSANLNTRTG